MIVRDSDFEDLVPRPHSRVRAEGAGLRRAAARGRVSLRGQRRSPSTVIYGFKRGAFWPFIPTGDGQKRDNAQELELKAKLEKELPIEQDLTRWLGLFDAPI